MTSAEKVRALIYSCETAPHGPGQIALAEEAVNQADALGDLRLRFLARMVATNAYQFGGEPAKGFVTFSWCLAQYDANQDLHGEHEDLLHWHFKYMIHSLTTFPEVPLARTYAVLDDMQRRFVEGGHSLQAVFKCRHRVARHIGDKPTAEKFYHQWQMAPRDHNSDCAFCDPNGRVSYLASLGRDEEAIAIAEPVLSGRSNCTEQPQTMLTTLLLPYLRTGRLEEARAAHHRAYRAHRGNPANLHDVADHIYFCGMSGNEAHGLELIERHWSWLEHPPTPMAEMEFASSSALVLRRLAESQGDELLRGAQRSIAEIAEALAERARKIAVRFDARNNTSHQSDELRAKLAAEPIVAHLPLSITAQLTPTPVAKKVVVPTAQVMPEEECTLDDLLEVAEEALRRDRESEVEVAWQRLSRWRETHSDDDTTPLQRGRLADLAGMRTHSGDPEDTAEAWREALTWYEQAGDEVRVQRTRGRLGLHQCRHGEPEAGLDVVRHTSEFLLTNGSAKDRAGALRRLAVAQLHAGYPADAVSTLDQLDEMNLGDHPEPDPGSRVRLQVMLMRAQALGADGRLDDAVATTRQLIAEAVETEEDELVGLGEFFLGQGLSLLEDGIGSADAYTRALRHNLPPELEREVRERRGVLLAGTSRAAEVIEDLGALVARLVSENLSEEADHSRFHLAVALFNSGRTNDAAEVAEEALYGADRSSNQGLADQVRHLLAAIYQRMDEPDLALSYLDQLAANLDGFDNAAARGRALEQAGEMLFDLDRDEQAASRLGAAAVAFGIAGQPLDQIRALRRQAVATMFSEEPQRALDVLGEADRTAARMPADAGDDVDGQYEMAWLALDGARVLTAVGDPETALARIVTVPHLFRSLESFGEALLAELTHGEILLTLSRPDQAEKVLRSVVNGLPRDAATLPRAAFALAHALLHQDRQDEAQELADEYGFDLD